jgi:hypothetical protein
LEQTLWPKSSAFCWFRARGKSPVHHDIAAVAREKGGVPRPLPGTSGVRRDFEMSERMDHRQAVALFCLLLFAGLSPACAQGVALPQVEQDGPLGALARQTGYRSKPVEAADFVRESRPAEMNYIPVHSKRPDAPGKLLTADELAAQERELDALKVNHDAIAKRPRSAVAFKPLQAPSPPKPVAPRPATEPQGVKLEIPTLR